jgi:hypothetical protein
VRAIGIIATSIVGVVAVVGVAVGIRSAPDIKRYLRMRSM